MRYWPGEDILMCMFAARDGARIVYDPAILVYHHRRSAFAAHLRQVWAYGGFSRLLHPAIEQFGPR